MLAKQSRHLAVQGEAALLGHAVGKRFHESSIADRQVPCRPSGGASYFMSCLRPYGRMPPWR
jgi:hypothetical protein